MKKWSKKKKITILLLFLVLPLWCNPFSIKAAPKTPYPDFFKEKQIAWFKS